MALRCFLARFFSRPGLLPFFFFDKRLDADHATPFSSPFRFPLRNLFSFPPPPWFVLFSLAYQLNPLAPFHSFSYSAMVRMSLFFSKNSMPNRSFPIPGTLSVRRPFFLSQVFIPVSEKYWSHSVMFDPSPVRSCPNHFASPHPTFVSGINLTSLVLPFTRMALDNSSLLQRLKPSYRSRASLLTSSFPVTPGQACLMILREKSSYRTSLCD